MAAPKGFLIVPVGFHEDGTPRALELTDSDELKVALATAAGSDLLTELEAKLDFADLELVNKILSSGPHGWLGGGWKRQPLLLGYSGDWTETKENLNGDPAGTFLTGTAVPPGEIWILQAVSAYNANSSTDAIYIQPTINAKTMLLANEWEVAAGHSVLWSGQIVLSPGDAVVSAFVGCTQDDDVLMCYHAVRVDIDQ